jgi:hypothetical protein
VIGIMDQRSISVVGMLGAGIHNCGRLRLTAESDVEAKRDAWCAEGYARALR